MRATIFARTVRAARSLPIRGGDHHAHAHGPTPPIYKNGFLFGEKPGPRKMENWEKIWIVGMGGGFLFAAVGLYYKPDTSLEKWATEELKRRAAAAKSE